MVVSRFLHLLHHASHKITISALSTSQKNNVALPLTRYETSLSGLSAYWISVKIPTVTVSLFESVMAPEDGSGTRAAVKAIELVNPIEWDA